MSLNRRQLIGWAGASALGLGGCTVAGSGTGRQADGSGGGRFRESARCVPRATLTRQTTIADRPLVYEISRRRSGFWLDEGFHGQLEGWFTRFVADPNRSAPSEIWTYGSWTDGEPDCHSWHNAARAFDLSRLRTGGRDLVSCRFDQGRNGADVDRQRRRYWALAASLHHDFAYVLTYLYNTQHHNHIHVDNGRSGSGLSTFSTRSPAQTQAIQAMISYLWDIPVDITGRWDATTRRASRTVLDRIEVADDLETSVDAWRASCGPAPGAFLPSRGSGPIRRDLGADPSPGTAQDWSTTRRR